MSGLSPRTHGKLYIAASLGDAVSALSERGKSGAPLAGATWVMRAPIRQERGDMAYVAIGGVDVLRRLDIGDHEITIGACVTHAQLVAAVAGMAEFQALAQAAAAAANPAIREVATVGGNLCSVGFAASDLVPALLCLDATIEMEGVNGAERISIQRFLETRSALPPGHLLRRVIVARQPGRSAHVRLPLRKAGDYPVANVSLAVRFGADAAVDDVRVAVGSVETVARRWSGLESRLSGIPLHPGKAFEMAQADLDAFQGRDGIEAPGWYRVQVLPSLVRRAILAILGPS